MFYLSFMMIYVLYLFSPFNLFTHCPFSVQYTYISHTSLVIYLVCGLVGRQTVAFRAGAQLHHSPPRVTQGLVRRLVTVSLYQLRVSRVPHPAGARWLPAGCPPASERAPEPVPAAGSGSGRLRPARAGAGGRVLDPGACRRAAGRERFGSWVSGHQSRQSLRTRLESSAGSIGRGVRAGKVSREPRAGVAALQLRRVAGTRNGVRLRPLMRAPCARALEPSARRVARGSRESE